MSPVGTSVAAVVAAGTEDNVFEGRQLGPRQRNTVASCSWARSAAHCELANAVYRVEQQLEFDPDREKATGHGSRKGNKLLTRNYRKGFEVAKLA